MSSIAMAAVITNLLADVAPPDSPIGNGITGLAVSLAAAILLLVAVVTLPQSTAS